MKLTQEQIEEIRKRAEAASTGPWSYSEDDYSWDMYDGNYPMELKILKAPKMSREYAEYWPGKQDAEFIVNARQDIPALLAHISSLEQLVSDFEIHSDNDDRIKAKRLDRIVDLELAIEDALSVAEMQKENFAMEPWASLEEAIRDDEE